MLKLKLQYFGHLMWRADSFEKTLMLGKIDGRREGDDRGWDGWMVSPTQWAWVWLNYGCRQWTGRPGMLQSLGSQRVRHYWVTELNPCHVPMTFITELEQIILKCIWKHKKPWIAKAVFEKRRIKLMVLCSWLQTILQSCSNQNNMVLA